MEYETKLMEIDTCPFCGSKKVRINGMIFPSIVCDECKCYGPVGFSKEDAVKKWQKMADGRKKADEVEIILSKV